MLDTTNETEIHEFSVVALTVDVPAYHLKVGDTGTVVDLTPGHTRCIVEFMTILGETVAVIEIALGQIRRVTHDEIANARQVSVSV